MSRASSFCRCCCGSNSQNWMFCFLYSLVPTQRRRKKIYDSLHFYLFVTTFVLFSILFSFSFTHQTTLCPSLFLCFSADPSKSIALLLLWQECVCLCCIYTSTTYSIRVCILLCIMFSFSIGAGASEWARARARTHIRVTRAYIYLYPLCIRSSLFFERERERASELTCTNAIMMVLYESFFSLFIAKIFTMTMKTAKNLMPKTRI